MREIKYRQPIRDRNGKFIEWFYWGYIDGTWIQWALQSNSVDTRKESQQFTGMKDKSKKEIYEGDIVQYTRSEFDEKKDDFKNVKHIAQIIFGNGTILRESGYVGGSFLGFYLGEQNGEQKTHNSESVDFSDEKLKVIGNIYEHPDLLK